MITTEERKLEMHENYISHRAERLMRAGAYRATHKVQISTYQREYRALHRAEHLASCRTYGLAHKEALRENARVRRELRKESWLRMTRAERREEAIRRKTPRPGGVGMEGE